MYRHIPACTCCEKEVEEMNLRTRIRKQWFKITQLPQDELTMAEILGFTGALSIQGLNLRDYLSEKEWETGIEDVSEEG